MAYNPDFEHLYRATRDFFETCIYENRSLIMPERQAWTPENVSEVRHRLIDHPEIGEGSFAEKLNRQMEGATSDQWLILADVHYVYYLPPCSLKLATKIEKVQWCLEQGGINLPAIGAVIWEPFRRNGFVGVSLRYNLRYMQLWLILMFADYLKQQADPKTIVDDPQQMQDLFDTLLADIPTPTDRAYDMRHALLYLSHPDKYEPAISTRDKERIVATYQGKILGQVPKDMDKAILQIRTALAPAYNLEGKPFNFYGEMKDEWRIGNVAPSTSSAPIQQVQENREPTPPLALYLRKLLGRTRNVILYGPPGTGKTYIAQKVADLLVAEQNQGQAVEHAYVERVTFHQTYSYEDFIEGWRPVQGTTENDIAYSVEPGVLRRLAAHAEADPNNAYILLIDEINRGNIAKIFGELITLLEDDKRKGQPNAIAVTLPYSAETFALPANIYVIGTMNTADRSIALLDIALRRRFAFVEIMPNPELLNDVKVISETHTVDLSRLLDSLNRRIISLLDRDHQIGHSYFMQVAQKDEQDRIDELEYVWNQQILPLLEEYFYNQREALVNLLTDFAVPDEASEEGGNQEFGRLSGEDLVFALGKLSER